MSGLRAKFFRGFADPCRLAILEALRSGPQSVGDLVKAVGRSQSNTSNHLTCLLECGLVVRRQQGKYAWYSLADDRIGTLLDLADVVIGETAEAIASCANYGGEERR